MLEKNYTGKALENSQNGVDAYIPEPELVKAVNLAIYLERPLFLTGDPGCGKTRLAEAIAYEWYYKEHAEKFRDYFFRWDIKSSSKAREGLYTFDNLQRLYDVQTNQPISDNTKYVSIGKLGEALIKSTAENPTILLIDEIDKAPIDFPNDLLLELDEMKFDIWETKETKIAKHRPLVIITSNSEKEMPAAFLRRCIYHHIKFPEIEMLKSILYTHLDKELSFIEQALKVFEEVRRKQERENMMGNKLVSTSEMIDWFKYLAFVFQKDDERDKMISDLELGIIPFPQALLKKQEDFQIFPEFKVELNQEK